MADEIKITTYEERRRGLDADPKQPQTKPGARTQRTPPRYPSGRHASSFDRFMSPRMAIATIALCLFGGFALHKISGRGADKAVEHIKPAQEYTEVMQSGSANAPTLLIAEEERQPQPAAKLVRSPGLKFADLLLPKEPLPDVEYPQYAKEQLPLHLAEVAGHKDKEETVMWLYNERPDVLDRLLPHIIAMEGLKLGDASFYECTGGALTMPGGYALDYRHGKKWKPRSQEAVREVISLMGFDNPEATAALTYEAAALSAAIKNGTAKSKKPKAVKSGDPETAKLQDTLNILETALGAEKVKEADWSAEQKAAVKQFWDWRTQDGEFKGMGKRDMIAAVKAKLPEKTAPVGKPLTPRQELDTLLAELNSIPYDETRTGDAVKGVVAGKIASIGRRGDVRCIVDEPYFPALVSIFYQRDSSTDPDIFKNVKAGEIDALALTIAAMVGKESPKIKGRRAAELFSMFRDFDGYSQEDKTALLHVFEKNEGKFKPIFQKFDDYLPKGGFKRGVSYNDMLTAMRRSIDGYDHSTLEMAAAQATQQVR